MLPCPAPALPCLHFTGNKKLFENIKKEKSAEMLLYVVKTFLFSLPDSVLCRNFQKLWIIMKRIYFGVLTAMMSAVSSCGIHEIGGEGGDSSSGSIWGGPVAGQSGTGVLKPVCYMTALDYQKGYDWRSDQARESVRCSLVVYADGVPIMKIPVGDAYQTSSDPDMHRIIGGHLYTDYSTDTETIIKRNGQELFRYRAREVLCGMKVIDNDVYTLGQSRDGDGFSYRKNGVVMVER